MRQLAPEELPFLPEISDVYFADPERALRDDASGDGPLRFGGAELVDLLSIVALAVMTAVTDHMVRDALEHVKPSAVPGTLRRLFGAGRTAGDEHGGAAPGEPGSLPSPPVSLTTEQLSRVRGVAMEVAHSAGTGCRPRRPK
ncbi:hypothetical protein ABGB17_35690 [Sphaerisporangium sp. B11E5]|uniref:hypothetical protein n=1 Tax=Sphaerisporangium sp. B11E5 TaxID=3153563 RepID=UPI00325DAB0C